MIEIKASGFSLFCEENDEKLVLKEYEGKEAILDISETKITDIEKKTFLSCKSIKKVILPETINFIGDWAFSKCTNLKSVVFKKNFSAGMFGRGVFDGCTLLEKISFMDFNKDLEALYSATINKLDNDLLFRSDEAGQKSWYEKWDLSLLSKLNAIDTQGNVETTACGEEDISYSGMVDGEMPTQVDQYVKNTEKIKCMLIYERLMHPTYLENSIKTTFENYILQRSFSKKDFYAWLTLREDCQDNVDYYKIYLDIVKPDKEELNKMISDLDNTHVQTKAFLINEAIANDDTDSIFDDLML